MTQALIRHELVLETLTCCNCGIVFALPSTLKARLKRDGGSFYCPCGHGQHFTENEVGRLRGLLEQANRKNTQLADECAKHIAKQKRLEERVHAGVCPCCNRTFQNLARHMATKHTGSSE